MTDVHHHMPENLLMGYATGNLSKAFDLVVAAHVSLSDEARAKLESLEAVGGAVISGVRTEALRKDSLDRTLAKIDAMVPIEKPDPRGGIFPAPVREIIGGDMDAVKWRSLGRGAKQCILHANGDASARLLFIPAGQAMPQHSHRGMEITLVLQGAFEDEDGTYARGDVEVADQDVDHTPVAAPGEDCVCLVATDARLRFQGILPRLAQPFLGI